MPKLTTGDSLKIAGEVAREGPSGFMVIDKDVLPQLDENGCWPVGTLIDFVYETGMGSISTFPCCGARIRVRVTGSEPGGMPAVCIHNGAGVGVWVHPSGETARYPICWACEHKFSNKRGRKLMAQQIEDAILAAVR